MALQIDDDGNVYDDGVYIPDDGVITTPNDGTDDDFLRAIGINPDTTGKWDSPTNKQILKDIGYTGPLDATSIADFAKKLFVKPDGTLNLQALGGVTGGILGALGAGQANIKPTGYQGGIPTLTASQPMLTAPPVGRRPGSGGINYGTGVQYKDATGKIVSDTSTPVADLLAAAKANPFNQPSTYGKGLTGGLKTTGQNDTDIANILSLLNQRRKATSQPTGIKTDVPAPSVAPNTGIASAVSNPAPSSAPTDSGFVTGGGGPMSSADYDRAVAEKKAQDAADAAKLAAFQYDPNSTLGKLISNPSAIPHLYNETDAQAANRIKSQLMEQTELANRRATDAQNFAGNEFVIHNPDQAPVGVGTAQPVDSAQQAQLQAAHDAEVAKASPFVIGGRKAGGLLDHHMAVGGIANLARGRYLQGETDGMADELRTSIDGKEPAALSHGEFVVPADVVSHLGNGNSDAGAKKLYSMMDKIRMARTGTKKQGKEINPDKFMPGGLARAYAEGGKIKSYAGTDPTGSLVQAGVTGTEQNLSNWAGPYITNMLGQGAALANTPYQAYTGPLTAGASDLQTQAFNTAANLAPNGGMATDFAQRAGNLSYTPTTTSFDATQAQQYMNPYLQASLEPQLAEARRQADITAQANNAAMTKAGAFGGGRQAILTSENQRNLGTNLANITGQGYNTAYTNAMNQFNADQARKMQENQFGANLGLQGLQTGIGGASTANQIGINNLNTQAGLGATQRGIESEGIAADKAQFEEARKDPYTKLQFQQSLLNGLPITATNYNMSQPNALQAAAGGATTVAQLLKNLGIGP